MREIWKRCRLRMISINSRLQKKNMEMYLALLTAAACALLAVVILFLPPVTGVADDGSLDEVIRGAGLDYPEGTEADSSYFVRNFVWKSREGEGYRSFQTLVIQAAKNLSYWITGRRIFDIRFLGFVYLIIYLPAIVIFVRACTERVPKFSQKLVLAAGAVLIFGDVGYLTYFNSFYPEALIFIFLLYMAGTAMSLHRESRFEYLWLFFFAVTVSIFCFIRQYCFWAGFAGALFCFLRLMDHRELGWKTAAVFCSVIQILSAFCSIGILEKDFSVTDQLHAMTRGVLFQSENPEETLEEFGIDPSYSLLTDISAYDQFPVTTEDNEALTEGFFSEYDHWDVAWYYVRNPLKLVSMIDIAVKANMEIVRENCGNFQEEQGRPPGSRTIFWSAYSIFKNRSLPKTIGYLVILVIVSVVFSIENFSLRKKGNREKRIFRQFVGVLTVYTLCSTGFVIIESGEAALVEYNGQLGIVMDILLYFTVMEILERLNIL